MATNSIPQPSADRLQIAIAVRYFLLQRLLAAYAARCGIFDFSPN